MASMFAVQRDVCALVLPRTGRMVRGGDVVRWLAVGARGVTIEPINRFLRDFVAQGNSAASVRSYAYVLQRWWRFLAVVEVRWDRATATETRDLVLWIMRSAKPDSAMRRLAHGGWA